MFINVANSTVIDKFIIVGLKKFTGHIQGVRAYLGLPLIRVSDFIKKRIDDDQKRNGHTSADSVLRTWYLNSRDSKVTHYWTEDELDEHFKTLVKGELKKR